MENVVDCEMWPVASVRPYDKNPRDFGEAAVMAVVASVRAFGWRQPLVVDEQGVIIVGHVRYEAARRMGLAEIPVHVARGLAPEKVRAYRIADNKTGELSEWDEELLPFELAECAAAGISMPELGFDERELRKLLGYDEGHTEADAVPDTPEAGVSTPGAVYAMGRHKLLVGDATNAAEVARLMAGETADMLLTDPPYNVAYEGKTAARMKIMNDSMDDASFREFLIKACAAADAVLRPGGAFYIWHADSEGLNFRLAAREAGWRVRQCLIWVKPSMVIGRQDYQWKHEPCLYGWKHDPCLYGWKKGAAHSWLGDRKQTTVLEFPRPTRSADHPTMKPVDLFAALLENSCPEDGIVLDSFAGSGTTVIAAERCGIKARVCELDPRYADVVRRRWAEFTHGEGCDWQALTPHINDHHH